MAGKWLYHHGILGQKWGKRNGPPYPLGGGDYSELERNKVYKARISGHDIYKKKHFDTVLSKDKTTLRTLSYNKDRTKNVDMFYAAHTTLDKHQYNAAFNKKAPQTIYDKDGNELGTGEFYKWKIDNKITKDMKVASEDSGAYAFMDLYKRDRDFYNFVTDPKRLKALYPENKYKFKGYRESDAVLDKLQNPNYKPTDKELKVAYRMFNYALPADGAGDARVGKDVATQRAKFFNELKKNGYGAVLDTNDAIYGAFKASSPVIVFDMEQVIPSDVKMTHMTDKAISDLVLIGRKALGV